MRQILVLGGGAAGMAAALAAAQCAPGICRIAIIEQNPRLGKKLLATGNGRCNLDNTAIALEKYFTSDLASMRPLLETIARADQAGWFDSLGLYTRADEAGRVYPYSNQAADVLALLEKQLVRYGVSVLTGRTVRTVAQSRGGYSVSFADADGKAGNMRADAVICSLGGAAGPQFGTDGFGVRFAKACGGRTVPTYPCLVPLRSERPLKSLAGIRARARAALLDGSRVLAAEEGEVQFTDYGLSGICIMQLSCLLAPGKGPADPAVELDVFPSLEESELAAMLAARSQSAPGDTPADIWLGLLHPRLGEAIWRASGLGGGSVRSLDSAAFARAAHTAKHWRFEGLSPCGWKQAQATGGGLCLDEVENGSFEFKGCKGLYFVGETLDCAGSCGGFNLHWAFGSGLAAGRSAAKYIGRFL